MMGKRSNYQRVELSDQEVDQVSEDKDILLKRTFNSGAPYTWSTSKMGICFIFLLVVFGLGSTRCTRDEGSGEVPVDPVLGFDQYPSTDSLRRNLKHITSKPHLAGMGRELAEWMEQQFKGYGLDTKTEVYYPYINYPRERKVAIYEPEELAFVAKLREEVLEDEPEEEVPTFHAYSASGNVTAEVVYANRGTLEDFQLLDKKKISVRGKIVLVRNGGNFRGVKVRLAEVRGAAGVLTFSDPSADGFKLGPVYPEGPFRPGSGVERGSVHYISLYPGDPLTPGVAATKDAPRLDLKDDINIPKIPSLPISYDDALPILRALEGHGEVSDAKWQGGLNITYWTGPSSAKVNLVNIMEGETRPIYNVIASIPGQDPTREVLVGNHRDAWVFGAVDPGSGTAALLEIGKVFGRLQQSGWRPRRTIRLCSWDGEEYGQLGSAEFVEDHSLALDKQVVAYLNVDKFEGNYLRARGTPSMSGLVQEVAKSVLDPSIQNNTLFDTWYSSYNGTTRLGELGSGSDYTSFYEHLGIASLDLAFLKRSGIYHSRYDSFNYMDKFGDPGFGMHRAMTQFWGKLALKLADSQLLPFDLVHYCEAIHSLTMHVKPSSSIDFHQVQAQSASLLEAAKVFQSEVQSCSKNIALCSHKLASINDRLAFFERKFIDPNGIPSRPWFRHILFAPGLWAGYKSQIFPAFQEAMDSQNNTEANSIAQGYANMFQAASAFLSDNGPRSKN